ncbi:hypothetical protein GUJ93_ZPchr0006g45050 [Zizania palustris]|uniref:Uncharacterized protein n=1 Tax=Zizania palustris TaxID=103762 RepID=A0A8J5VIQ0_ZIZPA|nr:hypothetical protein GUJ93_ZPchr0006g45050 [Zizania palustris]
MGSKKFAKNRLLCAKNRPFKQIHECVACRGWYTCWGSEWTAGAAGEGPLCAGGGGGSGGDVVASSKGNVNGESRGGGGHLEGI